MKMVQRHIWDQYSTLMLLQTVIMSVVSTITTLDLYRLTLVLTPIDFFVKKQQVWQCNSYNSFFVNIPKCYLKYAKIYHTICGNK